jgi:DNA-binding response OmpR family regulator
VLLVQPGVEPPTPLGVDEGWVRIDATDDEIDQCARTVLERLETSEPIESLGECVWSHLGRPFRLTRLQASIFGELVARRGTIVTHERLTAVGWPGEPLNLVALDSAIQRIRDQLVGTGLHIRTVRCVGYALA